MIPVVCLDGRAKPVDVGLYGAALEIAAQGDFPTLAPLRSLRRVHCWGRVNWSGEALLACAARGVPICYLGGGRGIGYFLPARAPAHPFRFRLEEARQHPEWIRRFGDWTEAETRRSLLLVVSADPSTWGRLEPLLDHASARSVLRAGVRMNGETGRAGRLWRRVEESLYAWVVEALMTAPADLRHFGGSAFESDLVGHFQRALSPLALGPFLRELQSPSGHPRTRGLAGVGKGCLEHRSTVALHAVEGRLKRRFAALWTRFEALVSACAEDVDP